MPKDSTRRTQVTLPVDVAADIDKLVGKRRRSAFITAVARDEIQRRQQQNALRASQGTWKDLAAGYDGHHRRAQGQARARPPSLPRTHQTADFRRHPVTDTRELAHQLIDRLPETQLSSLVQFLQTIVDPLNTARRNALLDDEPETEEDKIAATEARTWLAANGGKGIPHDDAMRRLGLE